MMGPDDNKIRRAMQPTATSTQIVTAFCAIVIASCAFAFTIHTWSETRNSQLVQIGVSILEIDPNIQKNVKAAREWALDLIDANAGGVKFSKEARYELLERPLSRRGGATENWGTAGDYNPGGHTLPGDTETESPRGPIAHP
jgi:hypothetical protein